MKRMCLEKQETSNLLNRPYVEIKAPTSATNGNLTQEQMDKLLASHLTTIFFNGDSYELSTDARQNGYVTYNTTTYKDGQFFVKAIYITISTKSWTMISKAL